MKEFIFSTETQNDFDTSQEQASEQLFTRL